MVLGRLVQDMCCIMYFPVGQKKGIVTTFVSCLQCSAAASVHACEQYGPSLQVRGMPQVVADARVLREKCELCSILGSPECRRKRLLQSRRQRVTSHPASATLHRALLRRCPCDVQSCENSADSISTRYQRERRSVRWRGVHACIACWRWSWWRCLRPCAQRTGSSWTLSRQLYTLRCSHHPCHQLRLYLQGCR